MGREQSPSIERDGAQEYRAQLEKYNDQLADFDSLAARVRGGEELKSEEQERFDNPSAETSKAVSERAQFIRDNYMHHELVSAADPDSDTAKHIESHLRGGFGSNFTESSAFGSPTEIVSFAERLLSREYKRTSSEGDMPGKVSINGVSGRARLFEGASGGRLVIEVEFDDAIGTNALLDSGAYPDAVPIEETDLDEETKQRYAGTSVSPGAVKEKTNTMYIIGGPYGPTGRFGLYTVFPGEFAPPAPSEHSSPEDLAFWEGKVWATEEPH